MKLGVKLVYAGEESCGVGGCGWRGVGADLDAGCYGVEGGEEEEDVEDGGG